MPLFRSGPQLPDTVRSVPGRRLAAAEARDGAWLVATRDALHVVAAPGGVDRELRWEQVQRADWDVDAGTLQVEEVAEFGRPVPAYSFELADPGSLLDVLRERVTGSVVLQRRTELARRRGFSVIGRRAPSGGGEVTWAYEFDRGVDPDDPEVMQAARAALREAQESLGLP